MNERYKEKATAKAWKDMDLDGDGDITVGGKECTLQFAGQN